MQRRYFLSQVTLSSGFVLLGASQFAACQEREAQAEIPWLEQLVNENDHVVEDLLQRQNTDTTSPKFGGVPDQFEIYHPGSAAGLIQRLTVSFVSPSSVYFQNELLVERMDHAISFLMKHQHGDGTIDLLSTNFHSTPDTGFVVEPLAVSYFVLNEEDSSATQALRKKVATFLQEAGEALSAGGIHTPNHRWVVSMALARIHALFPNQKYLDRVNQWLTEGIDIDQDGQYTERSTSVYSPLTDRCLLTIARLTGKEELYEPVRKNLELTQYFIHPNGEVATEVSRRQDQYRAATPSAYYYPYLYMAWLDGNTQFFSMARFIEVGLGATGLSNNLIYFLEMPELVNTKPLEPLPTDYKKYFSISDLVRIRRGNWDASILARNPALVTFQHGTAVLQAVRMASAFFGKGQFVADEMLVEEDRMLLTQKLSGPYYQPIAEDLIDPEGDWEKMPRNQRPQTEVQEMEYRLEVKEIKQGISLEFKAEGTDHVPVAIELSFRTGGKLFQVKLADDEEQRYLTTQDDFVYQFGKDKIRISGNRSDHAWTQLRGALPKIDGMSVYLTGYTPFIQKINIEKIDSNVL